MKHTDFEKRLTQALHPAVHMEHGLDNTILLARSQASRKYKRQRISFGRFLTRQLRCIGWPFWLAQGFLLLLFDWMLTELYGERFWDSTSSVARLLFCVSTLVAMMALPLLLRSRKYRMQEIESASYFSSTKLLMAKLAVIGLGDMILLAGMFLTAMVRTSMQAGRLSFYLFLPFLIMSAAYLYMMGHCSGRGFFIGSIALGTSMLLFAVALPGSWLSLYQQTMTCEWSLFFAGLLAFSASQLQYLLHRSPYAELQVS